MAAKALGSGVEAVDRAVAPKIGAGLRTLVGPQNADRVGSVLKAAANSKLAQGLQKTYGQGDVPEALGAVQNVANLAGTVSGAAAAAEGMGAVGSAASKALAPVGDALQQHYVNSEIADWAKPTTVTKPTYSKPTDIFNTAAAKGNDIPTTLVKNGIRLADNVDGGNYSTADSAANLRADAGKASSELLRPSLQMADYTTPKTSVQDIINSTIKDIKNSKGVTPGDLETQIAKAKSEGVALQNKYPDGMTLTEMHDNKITYNQNGKFSPIGDTNVNNVAAVNRSFGRTLSGIVQDKAPASVPVKEFNAELAKQYQAADYLDSLDGKKVPTSVLSKIAKTTAKVVGAAAGNAMGGGVLGGVGGYHIGGMVETMLENMPNPVKGHFLNTLEMTNPDAFNAIKNYVGAETMAQFQRRMLPAANANTPIVPPNTRGTPGPNYNLPNQSTIGRPVSK